MTTFETIKVYQEKVAGFFQETATRQARQKGFTKRKSAITGKVFVMSLVLTVYQYGSITLDKLVGVAAGIDPRCDVSVQAFGQRFGQEAVGLMRGMLVQALGLPLRGGGKPLEWLKELSAVYVFDSSTISFPPGLEKNFPGCGGKAPGAAAKVFLVLDWLSGNYQTLRIDSGRKADGNVGRTLVAGSRRGALWIGDLGFFDLRFFEAVAQAGSWFVSRMKAGVTVRVRSRRGQWEKLELGKFLAAAQPDVFELAVRIGIKPALSGRLVAVRVPQPVAEQRRRTAKATARRQGKTVSSATLAWLDWGLYLTNAPQPLLPTSVIATIYRIRWQVELVFKLWKSQAGLDVFTAVKPDRVECEFYAKLIAVVLFNRLLGAVPKAARHPLSPAKAWNRLREQVPDWMRQMGTGRGLELLEKLVGTILKRATVSPKRTHPSTRDLVQQVAVTAFTNEFKDPLGFLEALAAPTPLSQAA